MKAYQLSVNVTPEGKLELPDALLELLPHGQVVRVIILVNESARADEQAAWARLTKEQFVSGYGETDAVYDKV